MSKCCCSISILKRWAKITFVILILNCWNQNVDAQQLESTSLQLSYDQIAALNAALKLNNFDNSISSFRFATSKHLAQRIDLLYAGLGHRSGGHSESKVNALTVFFHDEMKDLFDKPYSPNNSEKWNGVARSKIENALFKIQKEFNTSELFASDTQDAAFDIKKVLTTVIEISGSKGRVQFNLQDEIFTFSMLKVAKQWQVDGIENRGRENKSGERPLGLKTQTRFLSGENR